MHGISLLCGSSDLIDKVMSSSYSFGVSAGSTTSASSTLVNPLVPPLQPELPLAHTAHSPSSGTPYALGMFAIAEVQVKKDSMVDCGEMLEFELGGLSTEPFKKGNLIVMEVRLLEDVKVPLSLLFVSQQVVDVASNGGLT